MFENSSEKIIFATFSSFFVLILFLFNLSIRRTDFDHFHHDSIENLYARKKESYSHPLIEYQRWTVNINILQFSSFMLLLHDKNRVRIETLFAFGFLENEGVIDDHFIHEKIQFALKHRVTNEIKIYPATRVIRLFTRPMFRETYRVPWKAICEIDIIDELEDWEIGLIDIEQQFEKKLTFDLSTFDMNKLIQFQGTKIIDTTQSKLKMLGHCVHAVYELSNKSTKKLLKWLKMQKQLGYKEIRIYMFDDASNTTDTVYKYFQPDFVRFVQHQLSYEGVCEWYIENLHKHPHDSLAAYLNNYCRSIYTRTFMFTKASRDETKNLHSRLDTNDCFLQFKYKYEYTTNFDFDEFILPRKFLPFRISNDDTFTACGLKSVDKFNYNIYDYTVELFSKLERARVNSVELDDLPYLEDNQNMTDFFYELQNAYKNKELSIKNNVTVTIRLFKRNLSKNYTVHLNYFIEPGDYDYVAHLMKQYDMFKCVKNDSLSGFDFNNVFTTRYDIKFYPWKSIFNTNLTDYTTLHYGYGPAPAYPVKLSIETAFIGHFRDFLDGYYAGQHVPIRNFQIDIEYYKFFLKF